MSNDKAKTILYLDELTVLEITTLLGGFCHQQIKYARFKKDLFRAYKVAYKVGHIGTVYGRLDQTAPSVNKIPKTILKEFRKLLSSSTSKSTSDTEIISVLSEFNSDLVWNEKFRDEQQEKVLSANFEKFKKAVITTINRKNSEHIVVKETRENTPVKPKATPKKKSVKSSAV